MKIVSGFFQVIAFLLMIVVVVGLPLALLGNQVTQPLLNAERLEALISPEVLARLTITRLEQRQLSDSGNAAQTFVLQALQQMSQEDWVAFYELTAPPEVMAGFSQQVVDGLQGWLDGDEADIVLDLQPIKANITAQSQPVMSLLLGTLPGCTGDQLVQMTAFATGFSQEIPLCTPPEPFYSVMLEIGASMLPAGLAALPDDLQISAAQLQSSSPRMTRLVQILRAGRLVSRLGWLGLTLIYLVAIPLGARSLAGGFKWAGWPSLLAGLQSLLLGLLLQGSHSRIADSLLDVSAVGAIDFIAQPLATLLDGVLLQAARPMLLAAAVMLVWGVLALAIGALLGRKKRPSQLTAA